MDIPVLIAVKQHILEVTQIKEIRYIDLFRGIGGFHKGLQRANNNRGFLQGSETEKNKDSTNFEGRSSRTESGFRCVWSNDIDKYASIIYKKHWPETPGITGDIRGVDESDIPKHDLLCAGFPCQTFSVAGKRQGFKDTRGTLFFEICRIAAHHRPELLLLENVKGLLSHDGGRTFATILYSLEDLGYWWEYQVLNSKNYGVPQNRQRVFIIGHLRTGSTPPIFPITKSNGLLDTKHVDREGIASTLDANYFKGARRQRQFVMEPFIKNLPHGYNTGFEKPLPSLKANSGAQYNELLVQPIATGINMPSRGPEPRKDMLASTIKVSHPNPIMEITDEVRIRRLTPVECERLQGFPDGWTEGVSDTQRYKCLGNAVTVNVIEFLGHKLRESVNSKSLRT